MFISWGEILSLRSISFSIVSLTTDPIHQGHEKRKKSVISARSPRNTSAQKNNKIMAALIVLHMAQKSYHIKKYYATFAACSMLEAARFFFLFLLGCGV
jgi:hypothetical protein